MQKGAGSFRLHDSRVTFMGYLAWLSYGNHNRTHLGGCSNVTMLVDEGEQGSPSQSVSTNTMLSVFPLVEDDPSNLESHTFDRMETNRD